MLVRRPAASGSSAADLTPSPDSGINVRTLVQVRSEGGRKCKAEGGGSVIGSCPTQVCSKAAAQDGLVGTQPACLPCCFKAIPAINFHLFDVPCAVQEYGGGDYTLTDSAAYFSNFA